MLYKNFTFQLIISLTLLFFTIITSAAQEIKPARQPKINEAGGKENKLPFLDRSSLSPSLEKFEHKFPAADYVKTSSALLEQNIIKQLSHVYPQKKEILEDGALDRIQRRHKDKFARHSRDKENSFNLHKELNQIGIQGAAAESIYVAWVKHYASGLAPSHDVARDIEVDSMGNVYVTGVSTKLPYGTDFYTVKYDVAGNLVWSARFGSNEYVENIATAIAVDASGNVYVTGESYGSGTYYDYATIKYNSNGVEQWVKRYNGPGNSGDYAASIAVDGSGNVYVTGRSEGSGTSDDYATIKYNSNGVEQWVQRYNGPRNFYDYAYAIAIDGSGNVYVTGMSVGSIWSSYATIKYQQNPVSVEQDKSNLPSTYKLYQNYPNPFNPSTTIKFALPERAKANLSIYNLLGEKVAELVNGELNAGYHETQWNVNNLSSGLYFYSLETGNFKFVKKMILLR